MRHFGSDTSILGRPAKSEHQYGLGNQSGNLGEPSDTDRPRDRARHRQSSVYRDPCRKVAGRTTEPGKAGRALALIPRLALLASITWIIGLTRPLLELFGYPVSWR